MVVCGGCGDEPGMTTPTTITGPWLLASDWALVEPEKDPIPGRPTHAGACEHGAFRLETDVLELDTGVCPWITVAAPAQRPLAAGTTLTIALLHDNLISNTSALSTFIIGTATTTLYERTVPIPRPAQFVEGAITLTEPVPEGALIYVHVRNHGANTYTLLEVAPAPP